MTSRPRPEPRRLGAPSRFGISRRILLRPAATSDRARNGQCYDAADRGRDGSTAHLYPAAPPAGPAGHQRETPLRRPTLPRVVLVDGEMDMGRRLRQLVAYRAISWRVG
ncbi:hypothetical protein GCM10023259_039500 [Thermocatellispora tengchongensis]